jgi:signal transduction histidine kinase
LGESLLTLQIQDPSKTDSLEEKQALKAVHRALEEIQAQLKDAEIPPGLIQIETSDSDSDSDSKDEDVCEDEGDDEGATLGDHLPNLALLIIFVSIPLKIAYQGQQRAQAMAVQAVQTAETEALRRQVTEARLAAMRAQIEPHFLFNTLGSIEHLIETDPARAGRMQRSLIAFLREAMPMLRETQSDMFRDLGRELAIVTPYLELLKMRMEERLRAEIRIPAGLMSAEFPPMMLQSLVENSIRHGLEPRPEGGLITLDAAVSDGRLSVSVSDTGIGFGHSNHPGSGIGLTNIRERLRLLYGNEASLRTISPASGGSVVSIEIPYRSRSGPSAPPCAIPSPIPTHENPSA